MTWARVAAVLALACALCTGCAGAGDAPAEAPRFTGGCAPAASPYLAKSPALAAGRITYCDGGDAATGTVESAPFPAGTEAITLMVAGYPDQPGVGIFARALDGSQQARLVPQRVGDAWKRVRITVPERLRDRPFTVRVVDRSTAMFGWAGVGLPAAGVAPVAWSSAALLAAALLVAHAWLALASTALPVDWRREPVGALLLLGVAALATIVATMLSARGGQVVAFALLAAPLAWTTRRDRGRWPWRDAAASWFRLSPALAAAALLLWIGLYPFDWSGDWETPAQRWRNLPIDNWVPLVFAKMLAGGEVARPMLGDWHGSDRPPLQSGLFLLLRGVLPGPESHAYQAVSTWAQCLALVAMAGFVARVRALGDRVLMLVVLALSALVVVNGLFVWPKLLAAAYCAAYHHLLFRRDALRGAAIAAGLAAAFALLAHGGAFFALVGSTLAYAVLRRRAALRPIATAAGAAIATYLPWFAWQRLVDPPGDRLLKWHLAGELEPTTRSFGEVLRAAYAPLSVGEWLQGRWQNLQSIGDGMLRVFADTVRLLADPAASATAQRMVESGFFSTAYALWLFSPLWLVPAWLAARARRAMPSPATPDGLGAATVLGFAAWVLLIFTPGTTVVHQGAYFLVLALQLLVMVAVERVSPPLFRVLAIGNLALAARLYAFDPGGPHDLSATYVAGGVLALAALVAACRQAVAGSPSTVVR